MLHLYKDKSNTRAEKVELSEVELTACFLNIL